MFAAREFQEAETIGFRAGHVICRHQHRWTEKVSDESLKQEGAVLEDDRRTMQLIDKSGQRALVDPCRGRNKTKTFNPPLSMGIYFLSDFNEICQKQTDENFKKKTNKVNSVWMDDQGGMKACRRILANEESLRTFP